MKKNGILAFARYPEKRVLINLSNKKSETFFVSDFFYYICINEYKQL